MDVDFHLVDDEGLRYFAVKQLDLRRREIADAEVRHLARRLEPVESGCHLVRPHQVVGTVQHEQIQLLDAEPLQRALDAFFDVGRRKIIAYGCVGPGAARETDAALARNDQLVPESRRLPQHLAEQALACAATVNVRVIEQRVARLDGGENRLLASLPVGRAAVAHDTHAAVREP